MASTENDVRITVKCENPHNEMEQALKRSTTVKEIKEIIQSNFTGNPQPEEQTLIYAGRVLKVNEQSLDTVLPKAVGSTQFTFRLVVRAGKPQSHLRATSASVAATSSLPSGTSVVDEAYNASTQSVQSSGGELPKAQPQQGPSGPTVTTTMTKQSQESEASDRQQSVSTSGVVVVGPLVAAAIPSALATAVPDQTEAASTTGSGAEGPQPPAGVAQTAEIPGLSAAGAMLGAAHSVPAGMVGGAAGDEQTPPLCPQQTPVLYSLPLLAAIPTLATVPIPQLPDNFPQVPALATVPPGVALTPGTPAAAIPYPSVGGGLLPLAGSSAAPAMRAPSMAAPVPGGGPPVGLYAYPAPIPTVVPVPVPVPQHQGLPELRASAAAQLQAQLQMHAQMQLQAQQEQLYGHVYNVGFNPNYGQPMVHPQPVAPHFLNQQQQQLQVPPQPPQPPAAQPQPLQQQDGEQPAAGGLRRRRGAGVLRGLGVRLRVVRAGPHEVERLLGEREEEDGNQLGARQRVFALRIPLLNLRQLIQLVVFMVLMWQHGTVQRAAFLLGGMVLMWMAGLQPVRRAMHNLLMGEPAAPADAPAAAEVPMAGPGEPDGRPRQPRQRHPEPPPAPAGLAGNNVPPPPAPAAPRQPAPAPAPAVPAAAAAAAAGDGEVAAGAGAAAGAAARAGAGAVLREIQTVLVGLLTSLLPAWNMNPDDEAAFAAAQAMPEQDAAVAAPAAALG